MLEKNVLLSRHSAYKIGGLARYFFQPKSVEEIKEVFKKRPKKIFILGGGTNVLFDDNGFDGLVLKPAFKELRLKDNNVIVGASVLMSDLVFFAAEHKLSGLEWAGGLPGTVGGAIRGNAGAFGGEIKDSIKEVTSVSIGRGFKIKKRNAKECDFSYRSSIFKKEDGAEVILEAAFELTKGKTKKEILEATEEKIKYRRERHPLEYPNVGSIFKNIPARNCSHLEIEKLNLKIKNDPFPVVPTALLIARAELPGISFGGAMISPKHANFIVNALNASGADVKKLINFTKKEIRKNFQVELEEEIKIVS